MNIRKYTNEDRAGVLKLLKLNTPAFFAPEETADFEEFLDQHLEHYFVAESAGKILACGGFNLSEDGRTAKISWDIVHPESQGSGVGTELTRFRIMEMRKVKDIETVSVRTSQLAFLFYARFGLELKETVKDFWARGFDMYRMECALDEVTMPDNAICSEIIALLEKSGVRCEIHRFPSGAMMIDVHSGKSFYVLQFDGTSYGFSEITEQTGFDTRPDESFADEAAFKAKVLSILKGN